MCGLLEIFLSIHKLKRLLKGKPFQLDALQLASTTLATLRVENGYAYECKEIPKHQTRCVQI